MRDAKICEIGEGTSEIQRLVIARHLLQASSPTEARPSAVAALRVRPVIVSYSPVSCIPGFFRFRRRAATRARRRDVLRALARPRQSSAVVDALVASAAAARLAAGRSHVAPATGELVRRRRRSRPSGAWLDGPTRRRPDAASSITPACGDAHPRFGSTPSTCDASEPPILILTAPRPPSRRSPYRARSTMKREILINANPRETRVAILEDDQLVELLVDRPDARRMVGDIYLGKVEQSFPASRPRSSTSARRRARSSTRPISSIDEDGEDDDDDEDDDETTPTRRRRAVGAAKAPPDPGRPEARPGASSSRSPRSRSPPRARASPRRSPGRPLPRLHAVRCARRREPQDRRTRRAPAAARAWSKAMLPDDSGGVIVRTVGEDVTQETFERELEHADRPVEAHQEEDALRARARRSSTARRASRAASSATSSATRSRALTVDSKQVYNEIIEYLKGIAPELVERVKLYEEHDAAVRQGGDRDGDPRPVQAALRPAVGRLPDHRADRGARLDRRELRALSPARRIRRRRSSRRTSRRRARSRGSSGCATSAASSSATSSTWRRRRTATGCCRSSARTWAAIARARRRSR